MDNIKDVLLSSNLHCRHSPPSSSSLNPPLPFPSNLLLSLTYAHTYILPLSLVHLAPRMLLSSRFVLLAFIGSILFVEAKVASPPLGLQRRKHHHHKKHHDSEECRSGRSLGTSNRSNPCPSSFSLSEAVQSQQAGSTLSGTGTTPPPDGTLPSSIGNTLPASKPSGNTIPIPPYPKTLPIPSRQGGIKVKDICFGFSKKSIDDGLAKL